MTQFIKSYIIFVILLLSWVWGDCEGGEVELWGECYNIEETDTLDLSGSNLFNLGELSGEIPSEIGNLTNLTNLNLSFNELTGEIPTEIGNLTNLESLNLDYNYLTGEIPSSIGNLTNLTYLLLSDNQLTGEIPSEIGNLTNLYELWLYSNQLTGEIPSEIGNLTNLYWLWLYDNQLSGEIPSEIGNLTNLTYLYLHTNQLSGEIPSEIGNLTNLTRLYLSTNQLTGEIPSEIGNLTNLNRLYLSSNQLTGEIPSEIGNLTDLVRLFLNDNQFISIPNSICNLTNLNWSSFEYFGYSYMFNNNLCPPYPECLTEYNIGNQDTTNCSSMSITEPTLPTTFTLHEPFPNPFNPNTTIQFSIPQSDMVSINVYNLTGRLVETLLNDFYTMGKHTITWDGSYQSSGMYFVRIESGKFIQTRKVVLVK